MLVLKAIFAVCELSLQPIWAVLFGAVVLYSLIASTGALGVNRWWIGTFSRGLISNLNERKYITMLDVDLTDCESSAC